MPLKTGDKAFDQSKEGKADLKQINKQAEVEALTRKKAWENEQKKKDNEEQKKKGQKASKAIGHVKASHKAELKELGKRPSKSRCTFLNAIVFMKFMGTVALLCLIVALVMVLIDLIGLGGDSAAFIASLVSNICFIICSVIVLLAVHEKPFIEKWLLVLWKWMGLGLAMVFIGVLSLGSSASATGLEADLMAGACYLLFGVGALFTALGMFGGKERRDKDVKEHEEGAEGFKKDTENFDRKKKAIDAKYEKQLQVTKEKHEV